MVDSNVDHEEDGAGTARRDLATGVLRYKWLGSGGFGGKDFCRIVLERFGMVVDDFGICMVWQEKRDFAKGYNRVVRDHLLERYGRDVVADSLSEARALFDERYKRWIATRESSGDAR